MDATFYGSDYWLNPEGKIIAGPADFLINWIFPAIGAKIVDAKTGGKPSTGQLIGRYLGYYVSIIPLFLGLIWVGIDARKQGFHDKLGGTLVVRSK